MPPLLQAWMRPSQFLNGTFVAIICQIRKRKMRKLFIFGGQRKGSEYLNDFFSYNVDTDEMEMILTGTCPESAIPAVGHTQRATIDQERHEIHVMTVSQK